MSFVLAVLIPLFLAPQPPAQDIQLEALAVNIEVTIAAVDLVRNTSVAREEKAAAAPEIQQPLLRFI